MLVGAVPIQMDLENINQYICYSLYSSPQFNAKLA